MAGLAFCIGWPRLKTPESRTLRDPPNHCEARESDKAGYGAPDAD